MAVQDEETIRQLKDKYVSYFTDLPVQKYAAQFIMRDEDTIIRWKNSDKEFADRVKRAEAEWVRKQSLKVKAEFALERLAKEVFSPKAVDMNIQHKGGHVIYLPKQLPDNYDEFMKPEDIEHFFSKSAPPPNGL